MSIIVDKCVDGLVWPDDFINKIICGDCLKVMKKIPDGVVDLVLTDPPYGVGFSGKATKLHQADGVGYIGYVDNEDNIRDVIVPAIIIAINTVKPSSTRSSDQAQQPSPQNNLVANSSVSKSTWTTVK